MRVLDQPDVGHVSVTPEGALALVMTGARADAGAGEMPSSVSFRYAVSGPDGAVTEVSAEVALTPGAQAAGWGTGTGYMLETDARGDLRIEHGDEHRKVFVTGGEHGLSAREIARAEGLDLARMEGKWGAWLAAHPAYGGSEGQALDSEMGLALWRMLCLTGDRISSNWLLFERGYAYPDATRLVHRGAGGESELHPLVVTAYGEGRDPQLGGMLNIYQVRSSHVVVSGLDLKGGAQTLGATDLLLDRLSLGGKGANLQSADGLTLRRSDIVDRFHDKPVGDGPTWHPSLNRHQGAFISGSTGVLLEENLFDHNGWSDGYDPKLSTSAPQPPSYYSHNLYMSANNLDVTVRDNIFLRGASFGAQVRSGGFIEDNAFIDNNAAVHFAGGDREGSGPVGNYTLFLDNLITSAGHKRVSQKEGALSMGVDDVGLQSALIGNIIAHLADPANPAEQAAKTVVHRPLNPNPARGFDDTIIYDWGRGNDRGMGGLDRARLDETTIQRFAAEVLDKPGASIADLATHLRAQAAGKLDHTVDADLINAFFREGFGLDTTLRGAAGTLVFTPDARGDGVRWDNRLNWSTGDLPGTQDGDRVDLAGNAVWFGGQTVTVSGLSFGDFGRLTALSGWLGIDGPVSVADTGAALSIDRSGQVWLDGYRDADRLEIEVTGGRFANTGAVSGQVALSVGDNGQALLATSGGSFDLGAGSVLSLDGSRAVAGFDGRDGGAAVLRLHAGSTLEIVADTAGTTTLGEFRSGAFGASPAVASAVALGGTLRLDLSDWAPGRGGAVETLIRADQITGAFDDIEIIGLASDRGARIVIDHDADTVTLSLTSAGGGHGEISILAVGTGHAEDWSHHGASRVLWTALSADPPPALDDPLLY